MLMFVSKAMEEIHKLRAQINAIVQSNFPDVNIGFASDLKPPSALQVWFCRYLTFRDTDLLPKAEGFEATPYCRVH